MSDLHALLNEAARNQKLPTVLAYNRIDGPGSSLDLREFQQALWTMPQMPDNLNPDSSMEWTRNLPRTIGFTINTGTEIHAEPFEPELIGVQSIEYGTNVFSKPGEVLPIKENWLLKILDLFGLCGVKFTLHNLRPGTQSSGLGGSATATTGVCILANELAGRPFSPVQLISMASRIEQEFGISITGTQEQSNTMYGGVCDYVWFPWGIPGKEETGYGTSIRTELVPSAHYEELEKRLSIFHSGITRASTNVNTVWRNALSKKEGYHLHKLKLDVAYQFREGLRLKQWNDVFEAIKEYVEIRTSLCSAYMDGALEIQGFAKEKGCIAFPLGAGGGGGVFIFGSDPLSLSALRKELSGVYREIPFKLKEHGHEIVNLPMERT